MKANLILLSWLCAGCALPRQIHFSGSPSLEAARGHLDDGEYYQARKAAERFLKDHPADKDASALLQDILIREAARRREILATKPLEEWSRDERDAEIETWMERAKSLLEIQEYEQALLSAEHVFLYDPENQRASRLIDEINHRALRDGARQIQMQRSSLEIEKRGLLEEYRRRLKAAREAGRVGAAKMAAERILLLNPEDKEALEAIERADPPGGGK